MAVPIKRSNLFTKVILVGFIIIAIYIGQVVFFPHRIPNKEFQLIVDKNQSMRVLAANLETNNIISNQRAFLIVLRILGRDRKVTAGLYNLKNSMSLWDIVSRITNGHPDQISVTFLDGWRFSQIKSYVDGLQNIKHLGASLTQEQLKAVLKIQSPNLEGVFYPSTYFVAPNQTDLEIYQNAYKLMQTKLAALYATRSTSTSYTNPYQMLILASLIQKETDNKEDMRLVSTVFNNRLHIGMKLQDDPAVFYGLHNQEHITHKDFQIDTEYNTYLHIGLPPTPICTPSESALIAASQPLNKPDLLYFVAVGGGKTRFSSSYHEHKNLVNEYLKK